MWGQLRILLPRPGLRGGSKEVTREGTSTEVGFPEPEEMGPPWQWKLRVGQGPAGTEHF